MSDSIYLQDKNFVFGVVAASAALLAALSYVIFGPESWRERGSKCTGLINLGNTCFVNAVIQGLSALAPVHQWLDHCKTRCTGKLTLGLRNLLNDMDTGGQLEMSPRQVLDGLRWHGWILDHQQQDACELYNILLSTIDEELAGAQSSLSELQGLLQQDQAQPRTSSSVLTKLGRTLSPVKVPSCPLRGLLVSSLTCCRCRQSLPTKYEYFDCLSIFLKDQFVRQVSLESCLQRYMTTEVVTDVECVHCSKASNGIERRNFKKKLLIGRTPSCLCIHVVRTLWQNDGSISKNQTHLVFPLSFDVSQFMDNSDKSSRLYRLRAVIEHMGGPHSGHYCTYRCHGNQWVYTSDSTVYRTSVHEVQQCQAYMLFYERIL